MKTIKLTLATGYYPPNVKNYSVPTMYLIRQFVNNKFKENLPIRYLLQCHSDEYTPYIYSQCSDSLFLHLKGCDKH